MFNPPANNIKLKITTGFSRGGLSGSAPILPKKCSARLAAKKRERRAEGRKEACRVKGAERELGAKMAVILMIIRSDCTTITLKVKGTFILQPPDWETLISDNKNERIWGTVARAERRLQKEYDLVLT